MILRDRDERYRRDSADASALLERYKTEWQSKMDDLRVSLKNAERALQEKDAHHDVIYKEKEARVTELENEVNRLNVRLSHVSPFQIKDSLISKGEMHPIHCPHL